VFLSADEILQEIESGELKIEPFDRGLLKPSSYVMRLGEWHRTWNCGPEPVKVWSENASRNHLNPVLRSAKLNLAPGTFVLSSTLEKIAMPDKLVGIMSTLSHLARFGVFINLSSVLISPGFGEESPTALTLEVVSYNPSPITLQSGIPVCHLMVARTSGAMKAAMTLYKSVYEGKDVPSGPLLFEEFHRILGADE
jgi:dCTP deaminase